MKFNLSIFLLALLLATSCSNQLDLYPRSAVSSESELTEEDAKSFLIGIYQSVQNDPGRESFIMGDLLGGDLNSASSVNGGGTNAFISNILRPEHSYPKNIWIGYYEALYQVNTLIESLKHLSNSPELNQIRGVSHYFRAYIYYNLVSKFGGVPVLRENTMEKLPRNTREEVYAFIEEDLEYAMQYAPNFSSDLGGDYNYVSKDAAIALMARTKLLQGKKAEAVELAEELIAKPYFELDSFEKIFRRQANSELIFAFVNLTIESSINLSTWFYTYAHPQSGSYVFKPNPWAMEMFTASDRRSSISVDTYEGLDVVNKYPSGQTGTDPLNVSRLAEMYLISAEGQGLAGLNRLNELRAARGLSPVSASSEEQMLDLVLEERRRELFAEGFRWVDMVRTGKAVSEIGIQERETLLPIPETELMLNEKLVQNPGY
ncbi:RagB/SusD family nutrient uptake outer membrane protein [Echinicola sp. CAU 1574]|uniref:RagB/SusD family nutrient uptake outer membrane protein n=1 Tax=Echinicola arenosa TaxID=2774144 RepID=A0ABR9ALA4_9BACT|nr:RagB/SusD family nutrient uptake outer membrane protein [Echinicola arenosa]MBD8489152.1 RagB/SusD family nutrient uptake outer membrane protein [Echinicola arenosa]